jgi:hypothetical protein
MYRKHFALTRAGYSFHRRPSGVEHIHLRHQLIVVVKSTEDRNSYELSTDLRDRPGRCEYSRNNPPSRIPRVSNEVVRRE